MADKGQVDLLLNTLPADIKRPVGDAIKYPMDNWRLGQPDEGKRAINAQFYLRTSTTASVANTEFSIQHGLGVTPIAVHPVLFLDQVNAQIVPLQVSKAADMNRIYLKSTSTSAVFAVWIEA